VIWFTRLFGHRKSAIVKDGLACLAVANLYLLDVWRTLIIPARQYHLLILPRPIDFGLAILNVLGFAVVMYIALALARQWIGEKAASTLALLYLSLLFLFVVRAYNLDTYWPNRVKALAFVLVGSGLLTALKSPGRVWKIFRWIGLALLPCLAITTGHSAKSLFLSHVEAGSELGRPAGIGHRPPNAARTALIIFDMLDYDLLFGHRPADVNVPEFERLRTETLFATNAESPAAFTELSLPAMTIGKLVTDTDPASPNELLLTVEGSSQPSPWTLEPNIFSEAGNSGMAVGMVGWYHPYCRLFQMLSYCQWVPIPGRLKDRGPTGWNVEWAMTDMLMDDLIGPGPNFIQTILNKEKNGRQRLINSYRQLLHGATKTLTDSTLNLVVVHLSVPHTPSIYNRSKQEFSTEPGDYLDNLELADRTLTVLRDEMEKAGLWESTNIVISADHGLRSAGSSNWKHTPTPLHVPFFLKISGFHEHIEIDHRLRTILIHDLLLDLLKRKITTPFGAKEFLDQHSRYGCRTRPADNLQQTKGVETFEEPHQCG